MKYRVNVKEISYGSVVVEADNEDEAYDKAYDAYGEGRVWWGDSDFQIMDVEKENGEA